MRRPAPSLTLALLALCPLSAQAQAPAEAASATRGWDEAGPSPIAPPDLAPQLGAEEAASVRYTLAVSLDDGQQLSADLTLSNLGLGDGHGVARVRLSGGPGEPYERSAKVARDGWRSASAASLDLTVAKTRLWAVKPNVFRFTHSQDDLTIDLTLTNTLPTWQPGRGRVDLKEGGYFRYQVLAPRANVSGTITRAGVAQLVKATRNAHLDHTATNVAPFDLAKRFAYYRKYDGDVTVAWRELQLTAEHGGQTLSWLLIGYKDKIVFSHASPKVRYGKVSRDPKTGYALPRAVQLDAAQGQDHVKLILSGQPPSRQDMLASYGAAARLIAQRLSKPFRFSFSCTYALQMTIQGASATLSGEGVYTLDHVNP